MVRIVEPVVDSKHFIDFLTLCKKFIAPWRVHCVHQIMSTRTHTTSHHHHHHSAIRFYIKKPFIVGLLYILYRVLTIKPYKIQPKISSASALEHICVLYLYVQRDLDEVSSTLASSLFFFFHMTQQQFQVSDNGFEARNSMKFMTL